MAELLYGFRNLKDVLNNRVIGNLFDVVRTAYDQSIQAHNLVTEQMDSLFVQKTEKFKFRYKSPVATRLQPLDENGKARPVKAAGYYDVGLPIYHAGSAYGDTRIARAKKTVQDYNDDLYLMLDADLRWKRDNILGALVTNVNRTFIDEEHGSVTVLPLANGDGQTYLVRDGAEAGESGVNHYRAINSATLNDGNQPFHTIWRDLTKRPENGGTNARIITFVSADLTTQIEALTSFVQIPDQEIKQALTKDVLLGNLDVSVPGYPFGRIQKNWVVEWDLLPAGHMISVTTGGDRPIAERVHPEPELQGFVKVDDDIDHPFHEVQYERLAGYGALNRVGAIVTQVLNSPAYTIPAGLTAPVL